MSEPLGNGWGNYSIRGIVEIEFPEAVELWPQTPGWWLLLLGLLIWLGNKAAQASRRYWRDRYRRLAVEELYALKQKAEKGDVGALGRVPELIKAVALHAYPRSEIAELYGETWEAFLDRSYPGPSFAQEFPGVLYTLSYRSAESLEEPVHEEFWSQLRLWITTHRGAHD